MSKFNRQLNKAFDGISGYNISDRDIAYMEKNDAAHTYGEITPEGLKTIFSGLNKTNKTFIDLGSGSGYATIVSALNYPFKRVIGVELSNERHKMSNTALNNMRSQYGGNKKLQSRLNRVKFTRGNVVTYDTSKGDIIYISNLCFSDSVNDKLAQKLSDDILRVNNKRKRGGKTPKQTHVFCSRELPAVAGCTFVKNIPVNMSWMEGSPINHYIFK